VATPVVVDLGAGERRRLRELHLMEREREREVDRLLDLGARRGGKADHEEAPGLDAGVAHPADDAADEVDVELLLHHVEDALARGLDAERHEIAARALHQATEVRVELTAQRGRRVRT